MKTMKILSIFTILFSFIQCGSTKFVKNPPFKIKSATYTNWTGGVPGVSGKRVDLKLSDSVAITFDSLFFQQRVTKIEVSEENTILTAHYSTSKGKMHDLILHSDTRKELKNKVPKVTKIPFELKGNEAILSYKVDGNTKYFKIKNIEKVKSRPFPKTQ